MSVFAPQIAFSDSTNSPKIAQGPQKKIGISGGWLAEQYFAQKREKKCHMMIPTQKVYHKIMEDSYDHIVFFYFTPDVTLYIIFISR